MRYLLACGTIDPDTHPPQAVLSDSASIPLIGNIPTEKNTMDVALHAAWQ
jgi:hypothetical protein